MIDGEGHDVTARALAALADLSPRAQLAAAVARLRGGLGGRGGEVGPLAAFAARPEGAPGGGAGDVDGAGDRASPAIDPSLLEAIAARALDGARGAVFTPAPEARLLAAFGLAHAVAARGGPPADEALERLLSGDTSRPLARALEGLAVLDPACGGGALLVAAWQLARGCGARLLLHGLELSPLAARAARARLSLAGARAGVRAADALATPWPAADLVLANPPFLRHEAIPPAEKAIAARASGLSRQADLSAHFAALAVRRAKVAALVWPRALDVSRSAAPLLADARARGGFALRLRSRAAGSFAASVDTLLAVWVLGGAPGPDAEASAPLGALEDAELVSLARHRGGARVALRAPPAPAPRGSVSLGDVCEVRFGLKTGCNAFFHLAPLPDGRFASSLASSFDSSPAARPLRLDPRDALPLLGSLKEARAPEWAVPRRVLFRPDPARPPDAAARRYVADGEAASVHRRPTCAARTPWWRLAPGRGPAPVLYPAKLAARAFAFLNEEGLWEDKKWHALWPRALPAWQVALLLGATPIRLSVDEGARQLTGAQAIADVDCRVLAAAVFPRPEAILPLARDLAALRAALARDPVSTDAPAMLDRPAQRELDALAGRALGLSTGAVERARRALLARIAARLDHAVATRALGTA